MSKTRAFASNFIHVILNTQVVSHTRDGLRAVTLHCGCTALLRNSPHKATTQVLPVGLIRRDCCIKTDTLTGTVKYLQADPTRYQRGPRRICCVTIPIEYLLTHSAGDPWDSSRDSFCDCHSKCLQAITAHIARKLSLFALINAALPKAQSKGPTRRLSCYKVRMRTRPAAGLSLSRPCSHRIPGFSDAKPIRLF